MSISISIQCAVFPWDENIFQPELDAREARLQLHQNDMVFHAFTWFIFCILSFMFYLSYLNFHVLSFVYYLSCLILNILCIFDVLSFVSYLSFFIFHILSFIYNTLYFVFYILHIPEKKLVILNKGADMSLKSSSSQLGRPTATGFF